MFKNPKVYGLILILFAIVFFIARFTFNVKLINNIGDSLWAFAALGVGLGFEISFFINGKKNPSVLIPGGILTIIGMLFVFEEFTGWKYSDYTWPVYVFAVAFGLFQAFIFGGNKSQKLLLPIFILLSISVFGEVIAFVDNQNYQLDFTTFAAVALLLVGIYVIFFKKKSQ
jgi:hypothetical protein